VADPSVSVVIPVRDGAAFVVEAVESVLSSSHRDLEVVVVDDGSRDETPRLLEALAARDSRVRRAWLPGLGVGAALNHGLEQSRGDLVARLDADDVTFPERLALQVAYLREHTSVDVCCGYAIAGERRPPHAEGHVRSTPLTHGDLVCELLFGNPIVHSSVMLRGRRLRYDPTFTASVDYRLWVDLVVSGARFATVPRPLVWYRLHPRQLSRQGVSMQRELARRCTARLLAELRIVPTDAEWELHDERCWTPGLGRDWLRRLEAWLRRLRDAGGARGPFPAEALRRSLADRWYDACARAAREGVWSADLFARSPLAGGAAVGRAAKLAAHHVLGGARRRAVLAALRSRLPRRGVP
jgi:glycosyltransferase involved in cell wall biosynthesis